MSDERLIQQPEPKQPDEVIWNDHLMMLPALSRRRAHDLGYILTIHEQPPFPIRHQIYMSGAVDVLPAVTLAGAGHFEANATRTPATAPPIRACFLLGLFLAKADRDAIPGDLEEEFAADLSRYGARRARFLFWTRTMGVIARRNPVCRWVMVFGLARLGQWILRKISG
jgi:hypothetical protein